MTAAAVLIVVAIVQGAFLTLLLLFLFARRALHPASRDQYDGARAAVDASVRRWLVADGSVADVRDAIRAIPAPARVGYVAHFARGMLPPAQREELTRALRDEEWVRSALRGAVSGRWSKRLEAARALAFVGTEHDRRLLGALLEDEHPAVSVAAVSALPAVADEMLVARVVDAYPNLSPFVRGFLDATLRELRDAVAKALETRLVRTAHPQALARWIGLAEALDLFQVLERVVQLHAHEDAGVRAAVARAARRLPRKDTVPLLALIAADADVDVRVEAVRSLGELGVETVPFLSTALHDVSWRVRRQAALSLALLGEPGRGVLRDGRNNPDPDVRDVAGLVSGLSDGALLELATR